MFIFTQEIHIPFVYIEAYHVVICFASKRDKSEEAERKNHDRELSFWFWFSFERSALFILSVFAFDVSEWNAIVEMP